jgi:hypothetical protein
MEHGEDQKTIRLYLLGELAEERQRRLEESFLTSNDLFEELLIAEDELVDEYAADHLDEHERTRFEEHFLSTPDRVQKLRFTRAFKKHVAAATAKESPASTGDNPQPSSWKRWLPTFLRTRNPILSFSLATALLLIPLVGLWLIIHSYSEPGGAINGGPSPSNFFPITLTPGVVRDAGELKRVAIPTGAEGAQLRLELASGEYQSYSAVLQTDDGREVFTGDNLKAEATGSGKVVILSFPSRLLTQGDYQVKLRGLTTGGALEDLGSYYFRVIKSQSE